MLSHRPWRGGAWPFTPSDLLARLRTFAEGTAHEFWPDDVSLSDSNVFRSDRIHSSRQLTDAYLLALAVRHRGRLAIFGRGIGLSAVLGAGVRNLTVV
jgi:predicted nucleic acid-binding protein